MYDEISRHGARTEAEERAQHPAILARVDPPDEQPPGVRALNAAERAELREWWARECRASQAEAVARSQPWKP